jgi:hypothetical protein
MKEVKSVLKELGAKNGLEMDLDENGACTLELADDRVPTRRNAVRARATMTTKTTLPKTG